MPYSEKITEVVADLAAAGAAKDSPLLAGRDVVNTTCYVAINGDRGLCGGYNAGVQRATEGEVKADALAGREYLIVPVGRKAGRYFRFRGYRLGEGFEGFSVRPTLADAKAIGAYVVELFTSGRGRQGRARLHPVRVGRQPGGRAAPARAAHRRDRDGRRRPAGTLADGTPGDYEFEPDPTTLLDVLLPSYIEARIYAALLNAAASEHAATQRAMKAATDNAEELIKTLSRTMNRARQDSITTEIMEIVSGAEALGADEDIHQLAAFGDIDAIFGQLAAHTPRSRTRADRSHTTDHRRET